MRQLTTAAISERLGRLSVLTITYTGSGWRTPPNAKVQLRRRERDYAAAWNLARLRQLHRFVSRRAGGDDAAPRAHGGAPHSTTATPGGTRQSGPAPRPGCSATATPRARAPPATRRSAGAKPGAHTDSTASGGKYQP